MNLLISLKNPRILALSLLAFLIISTYSIARPCADSLFLAHHPTSHLPFLWFVTAVGAALAMLFYNHFSQKYTLLLLLGRGSLVNVALLVLLLAAYALQIPGTVFLLNVWKEVYIVVMVEMFWSLADLIFCVRTARGIFGLFLAVGSFGGMLGNLAVGPLALAFGTANALWAIIPLLTLCFIVSHIIKSMEGDKIPSQTHGPLRLGASFSVVWRSRYLTPLLCVIAIVQITTAFVDYGFSEFLQHAFPLVDERTAILGQVHALIDFIAIAVQFMSGAILSFLGVGKAFVGIPILLALSVLLFVVFPQFATMAVAKVTNKSLDYSIFRAAKEILYVPLIRLEKTLGKALIDIFVYRSAKGISSIFMLVFVALGLSHASMLLALVCIGAWFVLTLVIAKRYNGVAELQKD